MKKKLGLLFGMVGLLAICVGIFSYSAPPPSALNGCVGGPYYVFSNTYPIAYGKLDTINGAATDSFKFTCSCKPTSIMFSNDHWKYSGSPTTTIALYASSNGGSSYGTAPIATYTVTPSSTSAPVTNTYMVNTPYGGNPYTNYVWVATNSSSSTMTWQGTVTVR